MTDVPKRPRRRPGSPELIDPLPAGIRQGLRDLLGEVDQRELWHALHRLDRDYQELEKKVSADAIAWSKRQQKALLGAQAKLAAVRRSITPVLPRDPPNTLFKGSLFTNESEWFLSHLGSCEALLREMVAKVPPPSTFEIFFAPLIRLTSGVRERLRQRGHELSDEDIADLILASSEMWTQAPCPKFVRYYKRQRDEAGDAPEDLLNQLRQWRHREKRRSARSGKK